MFATFLLSITNFIMALVEVLIFLRIIMKMFGASTYAPFVLWVYETTEPLLAPFIGMFPNPRATGGFTLEISALFAVIVYALAGFLINTLISSATGLHTDQQHAKHDQYRDRDRT